MRAFPGKVFRGWAVAILVATTISASARLVAREATGDAFSERMTDVRERLAAEHGAETLARFSPEQTVASLGETEKAFLATGYIGFEIDVPARVHVVLTARAEADPFWLRERGFERDEMLTWTVGGNACATWSRDFAAGRVGLGVPSLAGNVDAYFVVVSPLGDGAMPVVSGANPEALRVETVAVNARSYTDSGRRIEAVPEALSGHVLIRTPNDRRGDGRLFRYYRLTSFPSSNIPDQVALTYTGDPRTTQTVRWRTKAGEESAPRMALVYAPRGDGGGGAFDPARARRVEAEREKLVTPDIANDPEVWLHTARLAELRPDTIYDYALGDGTADGWGEVREFRTAPTAPASFSFIYLGDAQNGLAAWGRLAREAFRARPDAAFWVLPGDLVNHGAERDDWDAFFAAAEGLIDRRSLVPALGNHEYQNGDPSLYHRLFALPENGPGEIAPTGRAYSFDYANARFIVLDSNEDVEEQAPWLEERLSGSGALWKFVAYHHPAYASRPGRFYPEINRHWVPLFDKHGVDIALQGHDHAYLRTHPLRGGERAGTHAEGTTYVLSVSGTKMYEQGDHAYTAAGFANTRTWQVVDLTLEDRRLRYRAFDEGGAVLDEFVVEK